MNEDQRSSRLQAFDVIAGGRPARIAVLEAQLGIIRNGNVLGYSLIDRQKLPDRHVLPLWLVARIPELNHRFFPLIGDSATVHRVVGDRLNFRNMISSRDKRCFIKLKDQLLIGFGGAQYVKKRLGACWCCSDPGLRPLQRKVLRLDPGYLERFDSYGYSPIKKTPRAALSRRNFWERSTSRRRLRIRRLSPSKPPFVDASA